MIVKPAREGLLVRDPRTKLALPVEGGRVEDTTYWRRRLLCGDVVLVSEDTGDNDGDLVQHDPQ